MTENQKLREALRFTKKPVTIEAVQFTKALRDAILFDGEACPDGVKRGATILHPPTRKVWRAEFFIQTLEGKMTVSVGDWVIKGVKDEYYPCKPDIFEATYAPAAEQALALPTAAPVGDLPELPEPAAWRTPDEWPMCYQYTHEEPDAERIQWAARYGRKHEQVFTADQMRAYARAARAALSAGDAVDGPLIDEGSKPALSPLSDKDAIALIEEHTNDDNVLHAHEAIELIRSVERAHGIDTAMRKGQL